jgi:photosystem II stability/assembly factor-like uncharacterized protein
MRKVLAALIICTLFISIAGCGKQTTQNSTPPAKEVIVKIDSNPQGASVYIDKNEPVVTPVEVKLAIGKHYIIFRKAGYNDVEQKDVEINEDTTVINVTLTKALTKEESELFATSGPIHFDSVPHFACCSAAAITYSNIFYGDTLTVSGVTLLDSFDFIFPSGKTVHFNTEEEGGIRKFSKVVAFDEVGNYQITSNGELKYSFEVCYKPKILSPTPTLESILPDYGIKNAIAVPVGKEVNAELLITDSKGNLIKNSPLVAYDLKTDGNGVVRFKAKVERKDCEDCYNIYVNGKLANVRVYADILIWGYDFAKFSENGHLIESSFIGINKDANVITKDGNVYMPYGSFGFEISDMYEVNGSRVNMIISPKNSSIIYTNNFVSKDGGIHFEKLGMGFDVIAVDPNKPNVLYGWSENSSYNVSALFKSEDYGKTFTKIKDAEFAIQIVVDPNTSNKIYLATYKGLIMSNDGGKTWDYKTNPEIGNIEFVAINPKDSNVILVSGGTGLYKSIDRGNTWKKVNFVDVGSGVQDHPICIVFDPANPDTVYAGTNYTLLVSKDGGETWNKLRANLNILGQETIAIDPVNPNKVYVVSFGDGLYRSTDYGNNFSKIDFPLSFITDIGVTVNKSGDLLINDSGILFKMNSKGNVVPLGGEVFLSKGPAWKVINDQFYIAVNTIKSGRVRAVINNDTIEFYKASDMLP